jgi:DNA-binding transcriptional ArsR family regulator
MAVDHSELERLFLGLADKTRLRLLGLMANGPVSVGQLVSSTGESQPKISRHLAYLRNAGLVETSRDGKWVYYGLARLADPGSDSVLRCVVDELAERIDPSQQQRAHDDAPVAIPDFEWTHPPEDERSDELEIYLL